VKELTKRITKSFAVSERSVYFRNSAVKHWDGYNGQLITVIDDFGFDTTTKNLGVEVQELITLVSECDYILPMADLRSKGMKFTSPFIILTSNRMHAFSTWGASSVLSEPSALLRRFGNAFQVEKGGIFPLFRQQRTDVCTNVGDTLTECHRYEFHYRVSTNKVNVNYVLNQALSQYSNYRDCFHQQIGDTGLSLEFPKELPENRVRVHPICEALKVRIITKPQSHSYALKPLQLAMFSALSEFKCFDVCHKQDLKSGMGHVRTDDTLDLNDYLVRADDEVFLSGDYTSATDDMNIHIYKEICSEIGKHLPSLAELIQWEADSHQIDFSPSSGIASIRQETGQLMGSLLSFPILCLVNAFTICKATNTSLDNVRAQFHGDDVAAVIKPSEYQIWKNCAAEVGLTLSQGKNYVSTKFVSIDSQLWYLKDSKLNKSLTGKYSLIFGKDAGLDSVIEAQRLGFSVDYIRKNMKHQLKQTKRSLDLSYEVGGLGLHSRREILTPFEHAYHSLAMRKVMSTKVLSNELIQMPKLLGHFQGHKEFNETSYDNKPESSFTNKLEAKAMKIAYRFKSIHEDELLNIQDWKNAIFKKKAANFVSW
jgi:hypothetical protein